MSALLTWFVKDKAECAEHLREIGHAIWALWLQLAFRSHLRPALATLGWIGLS